MTLLAQQKILKESSIAGCIMHIDQILLDIQNAYDKRPSTTNDTERTKRAALNYVLYIREYATVPRLFADIYAVTAHESEKRDIYADLIQASCSRYRKRSTHFSSNAEMFAEINAGVVERLKHARGRKEFQKQLED